MLMYEIHTRAWLAELSEEAGKRITLGTIPEGVIEEWAGRGFTHIWLMGLWKSGPKAREIALEHWRQEWSRTIPSVAEDVTGSPYAIWDYDVGEALGGMEELAGLKARMEAKGLTLIADFVPNHFGIDTDALREEPNLFVQSARLRESTFQAKSKFGKRFFAHGKDPYFPAWRDTVQVEYRVERNHELMAKVAEVIAKDVGGLRCDMAMLVLNEVFAETWRDYPVQVKDPLQGEFWDYCIGLVKRGNPNCVMIAEAYWDKEEQLQGLGFDFTYNKRVYDYLVRDQRRELKGFLASKSSEWLRRGITFLENHDEPRIASLLSWPEHRVAMFLLMSLPGMVLLHEGQMEGRKVFAPIQMKLRVKEEKNDEIAGFYEALLLAMKGTAVRKGRCKLLPVRGGDGGASGMEECHATIWEKEGVGNVLAVVNTGTSPQRVRIDWPEDGREWGLGREPIFTTGNGTGALLGEEKNGVLFELPAQFGQWLKLLPRQ